LKQPNQTDLFQNEPKQTKNVNGNNQTKQILFQNEPKQTGNGKFGRKIKKFVRN